MKGLIETNEYLGLPHSVHVHQNSLGDPGNYKVTLDTLKLAEGFKAKNKFGREQVLHSTHLQFHSYGGDNWGNFESKAREVIDYVNKNKNITIDLGCVTLDETTTMTADGPFEHHLTELNHLKWANVDVELETAAGIVPYVYSPDIKVCGIQWAIGLELALLSKDPMRTVHHHRPPERRAVHPVPAYHEVADEREGTESPDRCIQVQRQSGLRSNIAGIDRELGLYEIAQMTRAGPAKSLGLASTYGGLKAGMDADVVLYDFNPEKPFTPEMIEKAFTAATYVFKTGVPVVKDGEIVSNGNKRTLWVDVKVNENPQVVRDVQDKFLKFYSVNQGNYEVQGHLYPEPAGNRGGRNPLR